MSANTPISALPPVTSVTGSEMVPLVQGGTTKRATVSQIAGNRQATTTTVLGLPTASGSSGIRYLVSDSSTAAFWTVVSVGGGANLVPVTSDGSNWRVG